jgi:signal transduction histidine kinase
MRHNDALIDLSALKQRTWPVFLIGFGSMLLLIFLPGIAALRQSAKIYDEVREIQDGHEKMQAALFATERKVLQTSVIVRDFLLDNSPENTPMYRRQFLTMRTSIEADVSALARSSLVEGSAVFDQLREQLVRYWESVAPVFDYTPEERVIRATYFLREQQRPRRQLILGIADRIGDLSRENYRLRIEDLRVSQLRYRRQLEFAIALSFLLGVVVAIGTAARISQLEARAERGRLDAEKAEQQMRGLTARLMRAQEEERKTISRELHDEVGQTLTALRLDLGSLDKLRNAQPEEFRLRLEEAKQVTEQTLRAVRDLAIGLRPSVLDLGLEAALQWQARQFSRHTGTEATVEVPNELPPLSDTHLTCMYRIVQEALTNSARHARASSVRIHVAGQADASGRRNYLELVVTDDGVGLSPDWRSRRGMGLLSIEERAREAGGAVDIQSAPGKGVSIRVRLPVSQGTPV